jgi:DNA-binding beta-propeller fold protein YncE
MTHQTNANLLNSADGLWMAFVISAFVACAGTCVPVAANDGNPDPALKPHRQTIEKNGIRINFEVAHIGVPDGRRGSLQEGDLVLFQFAISDTTANAPIPSVFPAAWLDLRRNDEILAANSCEVKAEKFIVGGTFSQAALALNIYCVLALNDDATISVIDPLFRLRNDGTPRLIPLTENGYDWVATKDQTKLFVSIPDQGKIAVVDTANREVLKYLDASIKPTRQALQSDGQYLLGCWRRSFPVRVLPRERVKTGNERLAKTDVAA